MSIELYHEQRITHLENRVTFLESTLSEMLGVLTENNKTNRQLWETHGKVIDELKQIYAAFGINLKEEP